MSVEQKLRMMQKQLLEITGIPSEIQNTIALISRAIEQFSSGESSQSRRESSEKQCPSIPEEDEDVEHEFQELVSEDGKSYSLTSNASAHQTRESSLLSSCSKHTESGEEEQNSGNTSNEEQFILESIELIEVEEEVCKTPEPVETSEEEQARLWKQQKIIKLEKSWQNLCDKGNKTVYK